MEYERFGEKRFWRKDDSEDLQRKNRREGGQWPWKLGWKLLEKERVWFLVLERNNSHGSLGLDFRDR